MPDDPLPPTDGDAADESTASAEAPPGPAREALDIPEWVSEIRRLYVEPKTRANQRGDGEPPRHRRLSGIRPSRRAAAAAPDPSARPTAVGHPLAPSAEPEPPSLERLAAAPGISVPPPLTPARTTTPPAETPPPAVASEPATAAPSAEPATDGAGASSLSQPWVPSTWTSPSSSHLDRGTGSSDAQPDPATEVETGSALARFADSAQARRAEPEPDAEDPVIEPVEPVGPVEPVAARVVEDAPVEVVEPVEPVTAPEAPPRGAGPGRPSTVPAVHLSWRAADSLHLGVPSVDDSFDAIVLEPPSQLVADTRRRSQRRRFEEAEGAQEPEVAATGAPVAEGGKGESRSEGDADPSSSGAVDGDGGMRRARLRRGLAVTGAVLVLLVLGWLVLRNTGSDSAAPAMRSGAIASAQGQEGELAAHQQGPRVEVGTCPSCSEVQAGHGPAV